MKLRYMVIMKTLMTRVIIFTVCWIMHPWGFFLNYPLRWGLLSLLFS